MRVLALTRYDLRAASARQRMGIYADAFGKAGIDLVISPLFSNRYVDNISTRAHWRGPEIVRGYLRRFRALFTEIPKADVIWVQYEIFPWLPGPFERLIHAFGKPVVVDYDDSVFHPYDNARNPVTRALLRDKFRPLLLRAAAVTAGNSHLADYARRWNDKVHVIPTVVDTNRLKPQDRSRPPVPTIGWMGSPTTWPYVRPILPLLREFAAQGRARILVVGAGRTADSDASGIEFRSWSADRERDDLNEMDIGIMPLPDSPWERGKCGYKLIQYMAVGIPGVASPVGVNRDLVGDGTVGLAATGLEEWRANLSMLLENADLRQRMGMAGRERAVESYSVDAQAPRLIKIFRAVAAGGTNARPGPIDPIVTKAIG